MTVVELLELVWIEWFCQQSGHDMEALTVAVAAKVTVRVSRDAAANVAVKIPVMLNLSVVVDVPVTVNLTAI